MKNSDLHLPKNPTLRDFQEYERNLEEVRGFSSQTVLQKCIMLGEDVGELFKAIRKKEGAKIDRDSEFKEIPYELADVFVFILSIANLYDIDLEQAFRNKEEVNKKRRWE